MTQLKRILVPTDFSDHSERAAAYAVELARRYEADEIHCVHVSDIPADLLATSAYYMTGPSEQFVEQVREEGRKSLDAFARKNFKDRPVKTVFLEGRPFVEIIRFARENQIDLIVISTHGRSGIKHALFGSVAEQVVRKAPCPVLVVKRDERDFVLP
ncbi:MAG: universal stress protein [Planctomycetota bacterium]|nr:universal stress protein [Planctomycetota bacterium]